MVLDTSALVAIPHDEPECDAFSDLLTLANDPMISAATLLECSIVQARFRRGLEHLVTSATA
jgi:uncharacterized protein with PIN domain